MTRGLDVQAKRPHIESIFSREFTFLLNNWILVSLLFFILVATTFPLISEALTGEKVTVGPPFYKAWVQPLGLDAPLSHGNVGTLFGWKKTSPDELRRVCVAPLTALGLAAVAALRHRRLPRLPGSRLRGANLRRRPRRDPPHVQCLHTGHGGVALRVQRSRSSSRSSCCSSGRARGREHCARTPAILWWAGGLPGFLHTIFTLPPPSRRRYGGYIVHLGIVLMFLGFTGQSWNSDKEASLTPGKSYQVERLQAHVRRAADGGRHEQADDLRRRGRVPGRQVHRAPCTREVHLQEAAGAPR